ncbi:MAG: hypothetical protein ACYDH5_01590 [Acidimicrobiales bacterium]
MSGVPTEEARSHEPQSHQRPNGDVPGAAAALDAFELEVRQLEGVVCVGIVRGGGGQVTGLTVQVLGAGQEASAASSVAMLARKYLHGSVRARIEPLPPPGASGEAAASNAVIARRERAQLLAVRVMRSRGVVEVHLLHRGTRSVGRGDSGRLDGAVAATLGALCDLGARLPFTVQAVTPVTLDGQEAVAVVLSWLTEGRELFGLARAANMHESASRATLQALNRFLASEGAFSTYVSDAPANRASTSAPPPVKRSASTT